MTFLFPVLLWLSQMMLSAQCQCLSEGITETTPQGTWVGAIAADTEVSVGWYVAANGDITFENR